ncbi:MAG: NAD+ synthase, partial [Desulfovibrio sp.]|nr:NAD+ synthase [Desulfovibrio sp.]
YSLARYYNEICPKGFEIPGSILTKAPSAELKMGQKDVDTLPPYEQLDPILDKIINYQQEESKLWQWLRTRIFQTEFKRRQEPPTLMVHQKTLGFSWQLPVNGRFLV